jgi:hypothetical protein
MCRQGVNEELRFSIRSLVKNFEDPNIWVIGYRPEWYVGNFVSIEDISGKFDNIVNCIKQIIHIDEIKENFVLMNDDFFLLQPLEEIKTYHGGPLIEKIERLISETGTNSYVRLLLKTYKSLVKSGIKNPLDYDIHLPMPMTKFGLKESVNIAYFPRSSYGNIMNVGGEYIESDVKVYNKHRKSYDYANGQLPFLSTMDESFTKVYENLLKHTFTEATEYEA